MCRQNDSRKVHVEPLVHRLLVARRVVAVEFFVIASLPYLAVVELSDREDRKAVDVHAAVADSLHRYPIEGTHDVHIFMVFRELTLGHDRLCLCSCRVLLAVLLRIVFIQAIAHVVAGQLTTLYVVHGRGVNTVVDVVQRSHVCVVKLRKREDSR